MSDPKQRKKVGRPGMNSVKICITLPQELVSKFKELGGSGFVRKSIQRILDEEEGKGQRYQKLVERIDPDKARSILLDILKKTR